MALVGNESAAIPRVAAPPVEPVLVYDEASRFGRQWAQRWRHWGPVWQAFSFGAARTRFPDLPADIAGRTILLVEPAGRVLAGAEAAFRAVALAGGRQWPARLYERSGRFARVSEAFFGFADTHPAIAALIDRLLLGRPGPKGDYYFSHWLFLRLLGLVYFIAFCSLLVQVDG